MATLSIQVFLGLLGVCLVACNRPGNYDEHAPSYSPAPYQEPRYQKHSSPAYNGPAYKEPTYKGPAYKEPTYKGPAYQEQSYHKGPAYQEPGYKGPDYHGAPSNRAPVAYKGGAGGAAYDNKYGGKDEYYEARPYQFNYDVKDDYGNNFHHYENSDGYVTKGEYGVLLPDGRYQTVTYTADEYGYNAEVKYDGEATYGSGEYAGAASHHNPTYSGKGYSGKGPAYHGKSAGYNEKDAYSPEPYTSKATKAAYSPAPYQAKAAYSPAPYQAKDAYSPAQYQDKNAYSTKAAYSPDPYHAPAYKAPAAYNDAPYKSGPSYKTTGYTAAPSGYKSTNYAEPIYGGPKGNYGKADTPVYTPAY